MPNPTLFSNVSELSVILKHYNLLFFLTDEQK